MLFGLYPYIYSGAITFIPDLAVFSRHLRGQLIDIVQERHVEDPDIDQEEKELFEELMQADFKRTMWGLSEEQQRHQIKEVSPDADEQHITDIYNYSQKLRDEDPLALMQNDLFNDGGQLTILNMTPGFEMTLFLAQATGSIVFTDSATRWKEMIKAQHMTGGIVTTLWTDLIECIRQQRFPFNLDIEIVPSILNKGKLGLMRQTWQQVYAKIIDQGGTDMQLVAEQLNVAMVKACEAGHQEMFTGDPNDRNSSSYFAFNATFDCIIPKGGVEHNNVNRLLVTCGAEHYSKSLPMVIFAKGI